jgi:O-antigen/teichoic acid export membrane protein
MKEYKLFAQRIGLVGIVSLIVNLKGLILIPILTKTLGAEAYGIWSIIVVTISLLSPFRCFRNNHTQGYFFIKFNKNCSFRDSSSIT